jgi:DNA-binding NarL/FixJ family response regulator
VNRKILDKSDKERILELYKCCYTPKEISEMMKISYHTVIPYIRAFKTAKIERYNREELINANAG